MNQQKVEQLADRIINETNSAISCLTLYLGHKLDLFNSLKEASPVTSSELAAKTDTLPIEHFIWKFYRLSP